ncbi:BCCT family transporter [Staphylococcus aureus]
MGSLCIVALVFAYFSFHKGYPGSVSAETLTPLLGEKAMRGPLGGAIDVLAAYSYSNRRCCNIRFRCIANKRRFTFFI